METTVPCSSDKTLQEFFKVFLLQKSSSRLQLPTSFTKFFNGVAPSKATLVDHNGKSWDVKLEKLEGRLVFENGWQQFAKEKDLEEGDFLVFQYDGISTFNVKIFSKTGCRKVNAPPSAGNIVAIVKLEEDSEQRSSKIRSGVKRKHSLLSPTINEKSVLEDACSSKGARRKLRRVKEKDNHSEKRLALTKCVPLQNPHFHIYFDAPWRLRRVELPKRVLKKMNIKLNGNISLRDENEKVWPVSIVSRGNNEERQYLGSGWCDFRRSKNI